jgi:nicotinic acid mononucleotide adenylyltransferase
MPLSNLRDPSDPRAQSYLRDVVRSLPQGGPPRITIVKQAKGGLGRSERTLGVFPASFNPPTAAHEALVREARNAVSFDECLLLLDLQAIDKEVFGAPLEARLLMLLALFKADPACSVGICNRGLFMEKVEALYQVYPQDTAIHFIVGHDTIDRVLDCKYYSDRDQALRSLFSQARFLVANRGANDEQALRALFAREENRLFAAQVVPLTLPPVVACVSSSAVRQQLAQGQSVKGLVSPMLEEYLQKQGFYGRHDP